MHTNAGQIFIFYKRTIFFFRYDVCDRVKIPGGKNGVVKFLDRISNELYAGIQLDRPLGSCDGTFNVNFFVILDEYKIIFINKILEQFFEMNKYNIFRVFGILNVTRYMVYLLRLVV